MPVLILLPGVNSHAWAKEIRSFVSITAGAGFATVVISHRGFGLNSKLEPQTLKSPKMLSAVNVEDFFEPATYINEKYGGGRTVFAVGISMGGMILTQALPKCPFLKAAVCVCTPVEGMQTEREMQKAPCNMFSRGLGAKYFSILEGNKEIMGPEVQAKCGCDLVEKIAQLRADGRAIIPSVDEYFQAPLNGFKGRKEYYDACSPANNAHAIDIPTVFLNVENDPFIRMSFKKDIFQTNPNLALATVPTGGHTSSQQSLCYYKFWLAEPTVEFLLAFL